MNNRFSIGLEKTQHSEFIKLWRLKFFAGFFLLYMAILYLWMEGDNGMHETIVNIINKYTNFQVSFFSITDFIFQFGMVLFVFFIILVVFAMQYLNRFQRQLEINEDRLKFIDFKDDQESSVEEITKDLIKNIEPYGVMRRSGRTRDTAINTFFILTLVDGGQKKISVKNNIFKDVAKTLKSTGYTIGDFEELAVEVKQNKELDKILWIGVAAMLIILPLFSVGLIFLIKYLDK